MRISCQTHEGCWPPASAGTAALGRQLTHVAAVHCRTATLQVLPRHCCLQPCHALLAPEKRSTEFTHACSANGAGPCRPFCVQQLLGAVGTDGSMAAGDEDLCGWMVRWMVRWMVSGNCWGLGASGEVAGMRCCSSTASDALLLPVAFRASSCADVVLLPRGLRHTTPMWCVAEERVRCWHPHYQII